METIPTNTGRGFQLLLLSATFQFCTGAVVSPSTISNYNLTYFTISTERPTTQLTKAPHSLPELFRTSTTHGPKSSTTNRTTRPLSVNADLPVTTHPARATTSKRLNDPDNSKTNTTTSPQSVHARSYLSVTNHAGLGISEPSMSSNLSRKTKEFVLSLRSCFQGEKPRFSGTSFVLRGIISDDRLQGTSAGCQWSVHAPEGYYLTGEVKLLYEECLESHQIIAGTEGWGDGFATQSWNCYRRSVLPPIFVESVLYFKADNPQLMNFLFHFEATKEDVRQKLQVVFTSLTTGYVTPWNYDGVHQVLCNVNASYQLVVPENHVVMVSFSRSDMNRLWCGHPQQRGLVLYTVQQNGTRNEVMSYCGIHVIPAHIFNTSLLIWFDTKVGGRCSKTGTGFKMLFSFHPRSQSPLQLDNGLFQCSTPLYSSFRRHVHCNMERECEGGEDEGGHCPFSSPACKGMVASGNKCYHFINWGTILPWMAAKVHCQRQGGQLAMMKTGAEWNDFSKLYLQGKNVLQAFVGLTSADSYAPDVYRRSLFWVDGSVAQNVNVTAQVFVTPKAERKACFNVEFTGTVEVAVMPTLSPCFDSVIYQCFVCQYEVQPAEQSNMTATFPTISLSWSNPRATNRSFFACTSGHVTHDFLSCDRETKCGRNDDLQFCPVQSMHPNAVLEDDDTGDDSVAENDVTVAMFACDDGRRALPYSLVCDFREDCDDASDEAWCEHREQCAGFTCRNGQCVSHDQRCDMYKDCWDGSDEQCTSYHWRKDIEIPVTYRYPPPVVVDFNSTGHISQRRQGSLTSGCPETHFSCSDGYCLPVYLFCNGVADCPGKEDEVNCLHHQCPGFYRCRSSSVCVHPDHLCDGWPQCPQRDDEWMCQAQCPSHCSCHGHAFVCTRPFPVPSFPQLRYLDASGSGMMTNDVSSSVYLTWLRLASCAICGLTVMDLPNLRVLDLSDNRLTTLHMDTLHMLHNLREIGLSGNSILLIEENHLFSKQQHHLRAIDLSQNRLRALNSKAFAKYPNIQTLNVSSNDINVINDLGFQFLPGIVHVDIRQNPLKTYPKGFLKDSIHLRTVYSDDYRLCCRETLHDTFHIFGSCKAPRDKVSSCEHLLKSERHRTLLWFLLATIFFGNGFFLLVRILVRKTALSTGFNIVLTNLSVAHLLMGVSLLIVGAADTVYKGSYLSVEKEWRFGPVCKFAGFLSFLSFEVSLFLTCLLLLERVVALFPSVVQVKVDHRAAVVALAVVWAVALIIVAIPVLPVMSQWEFYSQNGICAPLPATDGDFPGGRYAFGVRTGLNLTLSLALALGQGVLYWSLRPGSVLTCTTSMEAEVERTRRATAIIVPQIVNHFAIAMLGLMGYRSTSGSVSSEVMVLAALLGVPLNAALAPYLVFAKIFFEKRRKRKMKHLLERLKAQSLRTKATVSSAR